MGKMREEFEAWLQEYTPAQAGGLDRFDAWEAAWNRSARQPQERGEAVAWQYRVKLPVSGEWSSWSFCCDATAHSLLLNGGCEVRRLYAHPPADAQRVAELERDLKEANELLDQFNGMASRYKTCMEQLTESREREAKLIADLDANLEAFSDERKRALSAESLARELHELLADYVSQDEIAGSNGYGIGGEMQRKAEAFLNALAAEKGEK